MTTVSCCPHIDDLWCQRGEKKPFLSYHHKSKHVEFTNLHWDNVKQGRGAVMLRASIIVVYAATLTDIKS